MGYVIAVVFLATGAWILWGPHERLIPLMNPPVVTKAQVDPSPVRQALTDPPMVKIGGFVRDCQDCHRLFESAPETPRKLVQHTDIVLNHGLNDRCFNCHDRENRNRLALEGGKSVGYDDVPLLCAKCHGPTYRDWQQRMHGRTNGYWNAARGPIVQLVCTQCHNPHAPAFVHLAALPPPVTLRMGDQTYEEPSATDNPLRKWRHEAAEAHRPATRESHQPSADPGHSPQEPTHE